MSTPTPRTDAAWASSFEPCEYRAAHTARTMRDECAKLECELATAKAILASIEEDGTEEHNAAVRLRQELAAERARLDYIDSLSPGDAWGIYRSSAQQNANLHAGDPRTLRKIPGIRAAIDAAMKEDDK